MWGIATGKMYCDRGMVFIRGFRCWIHLQVLIPMWGIGTGIMYCDGGRVFIRGFRCWIPCMSQYPKRGTGTEKKVLLLKKGIVTEGHF